MRIGIPNGLLYSLFIPFWERFFKQLGYEVIYSTFTSRDIISKGIEGCIDDACYPVKICYGHIASLQESSDIIFLPRLKSIVKREYNCPMICGFPELAKEALKDHAIVFDEEIDVNTGKITGKEWFYKLSKIINNEPAALFRLYQVLQKNQSFIDFWEQSEIAEINSRLSRYHTRIADKNSLCIAIVGQPYNLIDPYLNHNLFKKLEQRGAVILTQYNLTSEEINEKAKCLPKRIFWTTGRRIVAGALCFLEKKTVDGLIYLSCCGCGLDSLLEGYVRLMAKKMPGTAYSLLTIDEHTAEAGFDTRLEAFLDMVEWRKYHENNISAYGRSLYYY